MYGLSRSLYYHLTFFFFDIRAENDTQNVRNKGKADSVTRHTKSKTFCNNMQNDFAMHLICNLVREQADFFTSNLACLCVFFSLSCVSVHAFLACHVQCQKHTGKEEAVKSIMDASDNVRLVTFLNLLLQSHFQTQRQLNDVQVLLKQSRIENNLHVNVWNTSLHRPGKGQKLVCLPGCHVSITTHQSWSVI